MTTWDGFHDNPRISYYRFLRSERGLSAREAHARVKRTDAMVVGLQRDRRKMEPCWRLALRQVWTRLRNALASDPSSSFENTTGRSAQHTVWGRRWRDMHPNHS